MILETALIATNIWVISMALENVDALLSQVNIPEPIVEKPKAIVVEPESKKSRG